MDDLVAFWKARLDEDDANAGLALALWPGTHFTIDPGSLVLVEFHRRRDPARVLRDVEADRAILALLKQDVTDGRERDYEATEMLEQVVRIRAARFSGHPDYRPEWKP